jgi:ribose 5-phosphate isomerase
MAIWNTLRPFVTFNGHFVIVWSFGTFHPIFVYFSKKNLATLMAVVAKSLFKKLASEEYRCTRPEVVKTEQCDQKC